MHPKLYSELVPWYLLLDPREDHQEDGACYTALLLEILGQRGGTLLELGAGAGNTASYRVWMRF